MNKLPETFQPPPSPPESDQASWTSHVAKPVDAPLIRQNEYFIPRDGIDGDVLATDLPLYLGNHALQRPGTFEDKETGRIIQGYSITAYRNLTSAMLADIKADSARWEQERAQCQRAASHPVYTTDQKIKQWQGAVSPSGGSMYEN